MAQLMPAVPYLLLPISSSVNEAGHLEIAGCDVVHLAEMFGTPLYLYDQATMDVSLNDYLAAFATLWSGEGRVAYAAKAWWCTAMAQWVAARSIGVDVVSEGELRIALRGGVEPVRIHAHGNNKPEAFLRLCVEVGVGRVVVDHPDEASMLEALCRDTGRHQAVWLRVNPGTAAHTHASIETGASTSKFGMSLKDGTATQVARMLRRSSYLSLVGVHFHIGSQISDTGTIREAASRVVEWLGEVREEMGWIPKELSPGGGWAVAYRPDDQALAPAVAIHEIGTHLEQLLLERGFSLPELVVEPGRELVARAGVALYTVNATKRAGSVTYAFLDGGLADNPRPALYGARYWTLNASRAGRRPETCYTLAGPYCESGDILIHDIELPSLAPGDIIAVPVSGAYQLSMSSNYNGALRPAVLWLREGDAQLVQAREAIEALWDRDRDLNL